MLIRILDGFPVEYSIHRLRRDNPQVSMRENPSDETLAEFGVYRVSETEPPQVGEDEQLVSLPPVLIDGVWTQQWGVEAKPVYVPPVISDRQFFHALAKQGMISEDDALAAVATGTIPPTMAAIVDAIPDASARFDAKMFLSGAVEFRRNHPLVDVFANAMDMSGEDVDALFIYAASL